MSTIKDIAGYCGVSASTVSRALAGSNLISEKTKEQIREAARKLHYSPNMMARALAGIGTKTVGLLTMAVDGNYYASVVDEIGRELSNKGYSMMVGIGDYNLDLEMACLCAFRDRQMDGVIMVGPFSKGLNDAIPSIENIIVRPAVIVQAERYSERATHINLDDRAGMTQAVNYLLQLGHTQLGFITEKRTRSGRLETFLSVARELQFQVPQEYIQVGQSHYEMGGYEAMQNLMRQPRRPTAVLFSSDNIAFGAMKAAYQQGISIPEELSFIGYDGVKEAFFQYKSLTTVMQPIAELSRLAVHYLIQNIEQTVERENANITLTVTPRLSIQETTAPPRNLPKR